MAKASKSLDAVTPPFIRIYSVCQAHILRPKRLAYIHPAAYSEKPATAPVQTVNVGVAISPQRLDEIRSKLEQTRSAFSNPPASASLLNPFVV